MRFWSGLLRNFVKKSVRDIDKFKTCKKQVFPDKSTSNNADIV